MPPRHLAILAPILFTILASCHHRWRPPTEHVQSPTPQTTINLTDYALFQTNIDLLYNVTRLPKSTDTTRQTLRLQGNQSQTGILINRTLENLTPYLAPPNGHPPQSIIWPEKQTETALFLSFDPPLPIAPKTIHANQPVNYESTVWLFNRHGYPVAKGQTTRIATLEGFESITANQITYPDCARLLTTTGFKFPWGTNITLTDYQWLAENVGPVCHVRNFQGTIFFVGFNQTHRHELIIRNPQPNQTLNGPTAWHRAAITLNKLLPNPNLTGLTIDMTRNPRPTDKP